MRTAVGRGEDGAMARRDYVFDYEAEPADERPTGYGDTHFGQTQFGHSQFSHTDLGRTSSDPWGLTSTAAAPAPWAMSAHSTFEEPSRAIDRVQQRRRQRRLKISLALVFALIAALAAAAIVLTHPWVA
jgi:hypothetical protein